MAFQGGFPVEFLLAFLTLVLFIVLMLVVVVVEGGAPVEGHPAVGADELSLPYGFADEGVSLQVPLELVGAPAVVAFVGSGCSESSFTMIYFNTLNGYLWYLLI